jgi:hypothetical protein
MVDSDHIKPDVFEKQMTTSHFEALYQGPLMDLKKAKKPQN